MEKEIHEERGEATPTEFSESMSAPLEPRWGIAGTLMLGTIILVVYFVLQVAVLFGFAALAVKRSPSLDPVTLERMIDSNGFIVALSVLLSTVVCLGLVFLAVKIRKGSTIQDYLAVRPVRGLTVAKWLGITLVFALGSDCLTRLLGRPVVPEFMFKTYRTAYFVPLLWIAFAAAAPIFEETLFRGFIFEGIDRSRLGSVPAIIITSFVWTMIHIQYDSYQLATIFVGGLLLGIARNRTGSIYPGMAMHALINAISMTEVAILSSMGMTGG